MSKRGLRVSAAGGVLVFGAACWLGAGAVRAQDAPRQKYDFEDGVQGFNAVMFKDGQFGVDTGATVSSTKDLAKVGHGALAYGYKVEPNSMHVLALDLKAPQGTRAFSLWVRSANRTCLSLVAREADGSSYELQFYVPAQEWAQVSSNLGEFRPSGDSTDENGKLDVDQITNLSVVDFANMLVNVPPLSGSFTGARQIWLDDLQFSKEQLPVAAGTVTVGTQKAVVVSNFETGVIDWMPVRVNFANGAPMFDVFPETTSMRVLPEAAGPGAGKTPLEPGGKGLRISYKRGAQEAYGFVRSIERQPLPASTDRLHLSINASTKSMILVQVKEKDDSEYNFVIAPDDSVGWRTLDLPLDSLTLGGESKDENNKLDPDQIKEVSVFDASALMGLGAVDVTLDLDAVYFTVK